MKIISKPISLKQLKEIAKRKFGNLVKAVVDVEKQLLAIDGELHADEEALLIEHSSKQQHLWGINLYPELKGKDFIEFDSLINLRPSVGNMTRGVDNVATRKKIVKIVNGLIKQ